MRTFLVDLCKSIKGMHHLQKEKEIDTRIDLLSSNLMELGNVIRLLSNYRNIIVPSHLLFQLIQLNKNLMIIMISLKNQWTWELLKTNLEDVSMLPRKNLPLMSERSGTIPSDIILRNQRFIKWQKPWAIISKNFFRR